MGDRTARKAQTHNKRQMKARRNPRSSREIDEQCKQNGEEQERVCREDRWYLHGFPGSSPVCWFVGLSVLERWIQRTVCLFPEPIDQSNERNQLNSSFVDRTNQQTSSLASECPFAPASAIRRKYEFSIRMQYEAPLIGSGDARGRQGAGNRCTECGLTPRIRSSFPAGKPKSQ